jgi:hypothetical protein
MRRGGRVQGAALGSGVKRLGIVGTMVWDTIHGRGDRLEPVEEWGGIAYALAALEVALPTDWAMVPLIKVGRDLATRANAFLATLTKRAGAARFIEVQAANNRVTIRYADAVRRAERLSGGVPPWQWPELGPLIRDLDAIYVTSSPASRWTSRPLNTYVADSTDRFMPTSTASCSA